MFELLTRILLWVLIGVILYYIFIQFIPRAYLTWLGGIVVAAFILLAFLDPTDSVIGSVWNVMSLPLRPLGLTILLLFSALRGGINKADGSLVTTALLVLLISSTPIVAYWLTSQTEQAVFETVTFLGDRPADPATVRAIVVLGDSNNPADPSYRTQTQIDNTEDGSGTALVSRLLYAAELYQDQVGQGNNPLVIVSAGPQLEQEQEETGEAQAATDLLINMGVPADRVLIESTGVNLRSRATEVDRLLQERGFGGSDTIILVAPAISIRRASSTFSQLDLTVIPRPTDVFTFQLQEGGRLVRLTDLVPSVEALTLTTRVVDEYLTYIYYFLRGWLISPIGI